MAAVTEFLRAKLKLKVDAGESAVARPWERTFLGYSITWHKRPKLRIAGTSHKRFKAKIREVFRNGRGQSLKKTVRQLNPILRGWVDYFLVTERGAGRVRWMAEAQTADAALAAAEMAAWRAPKT